MEFLTDPRGMARVPDADGARDRSRHRQHHLHLDPDRPAAGGGQQRADATIGLALAMLMRIVLLLSLTWVMKLTDDLFTVFGQAISGRDLILILGGAFLIAKSTQEVHNSLEGMADEHNAAGTRDVRQRARADRRDRHRLLAGLGDHRGRPGAARRGDDRRHRDLGADHDDGGGLDQSFRRTTTRRSRCWRCRSCC